MSSATVTSSFRSQTSAFGAASLTAGRSDRAGSLQWSPVVAADILLALTLGPALLTAVFVPDWALAANPLSDVAVTRLWRAVWTFVICVGLAAVMMRSSRGDQVGPRIGSTNAAMATIMLLAGMVNLGLSSQFAVVWIHLFCALVSSLVVFSISGSVANILVQLPMIQRRLRRRLAIYGASVEAQRVVEALKDNFEPLELVGIYEDRQGLSDRVVTALRLAGRMDDLVDLAAAGRVDQILIALPHSAMDRIKTIADRLSRFPVDIDVCTHFASDYPVNLDLRPHCANVGPAGLLRIHRRPLRDWQIVAKNMLDRCLGFLLLTACLPVLLIVAIAIKIDSPGPAFFRQRRHGLLNETIMIWKFRTMRTQEDSASISQAIRNDPRVTRVGRILRNSSVDELPQLINVVRGEMSLVGPRPHAIAHNNMYSEVVSRYWSRHQIKPGMTGWAQVNGFRGETRAPEDMKKRIEHDLWYIANWSISLDLRIMALTPIYGLVTRNAY